jgi:D-sedoheptulose 7-phosphate isomerase
VKGIQVLALDVDGVLTDGRVILRADGQESKAVCFQDIDAVFDARRRGIEVALVTGESALWVQTLAQRLDVRHLVTGAKDKLAALCELAQRCSTSLDMMCYVGDSDRDAPALRAVGLGFAPSNSTPAARRAAGAVLRAAGGYGAVSEVVSILARREGESDAAPELQRVSGGFENAQEQIRAWAGETISIIQKSVDELSDRIVLASGMIGKALDKGGKVLIFGNGGSAADAQHFAAELIGRFEKERPGLAGLALTTDTSTLTALGNDYGEHTIFSRQIEALGHREDIGFAISTSGQSPNVLHALTACNRLGIQTIGLTGHDGGRIKSLVSLCLIVPAESTARIQESHRFIIHAICGLIERAIPANQ